LGKDPPRFFERTLGEEPPNRKDKFVNQTFKTFAGFLLFFVVIMFFVTQSNTNKSKIVDWNYTQFMAAVGESKVKAVTISAEDRLIRGVDQDKNEFKVSQPEDATLTGKLIESGVTVTAEEIKKPNLFLQILLSYGPMILLVVWFIFIMRQAQSGAGGAMAFGKSRARLVNSGQQKVTFADVAGVDEAKVELMEVVDYLKNPKKYQSLGGKVPKGVLLLGPPGTGKTLLAKAVAGEAGVPFFSISGSDFVEMFVGVGASRVRDLFEQGKKQAPCIIFIDEIDAVGRQRGAGLGGGHDEREQTLNALLVEMDGFNTNTGVILIAATNRMDVLDQALLRPGRFDRQVVVDRPDVGGREAILKVHARGVTMSPDVDLSIIARRTPGFSGADLANLINEAALLAARRDKKAVELPELEESIDRVMAGPERRTRVISDKEKIIVAYHESGHAIVAKKTNQSNLVHKVSIIPRGSAALGATWYLPKEEKFLASKAELLNEIKSLLGGRSAEELIFGDVTTGAGNDLERATALAHAMVCDYGMSDKLGPTAFGHRDGMVFIGRDLMKEKTYSEETARIIDSEVKRIVVECHKEAQAILKKNKKYLKAMADALLEREVLDAAEVDLILAGKKMPPKPKAPQAPEAPSVTAQPLPTPKATAVLRPATAKPDEGSQASCEATSPKGNRRG
jgi:cell division protease FtsH